MVFNLPVFMAVFCVAIGVVLAAPPPAGERKNESFMAKIETKCAGADFKEPKWDNATLRGVEECFALQPMQTMNTTMNSTSTGSSNSSSSQNMNTDWKATMCKVPICIGQKLGVMDAKGMPVKANITTHLQALAPSSKLSDITTAITGCLDKHANKLDMTKCDTYETLFDCVHNDVGKVCQWPMPKDSKERD